MKKDNSGNARKCALKKGVSLHDTRMGRNLELPGIVEFMDTITRGRKMQENANKKKRAGIDEKSRTKKEFVNTIYAREHPDILDTLKEALPGEADWRDTGECLGRRQYLSFS